MRLTSFGVVYPGVEELVIIGFEEMLDALLDAEILGDTFFKKRFDFGVIPAGKVALLRLSEINGILDFGVTTWPLAIATFLGVVTSPFGFVGVIALDPPFGGVGVF
mgnify:CR=1 FL=1